MLSRNPAAIRLLEKNQEKIYWHYLSANPAVEAIQLLKLNRDKINWKYLSENPAIFEKDLSRITQMGEFLTK